MIYGCSSFCGGEDHHLIASQNVASLVCNCPSAFFILLFAIIVIFVDIGLMIELTYEIQIFVIDEQNIVGGFICDGEVRNCPEIVIIFVGIIVKISGFGGFIKKVVDMFMSNVIRTPKSNALRKNSTKKL